MEAMVAEFEKKGLEMDGQVERGTIGSMSVYIFPATFYARGVIHYSPYRAGDKQKPAKGKGTIPGNANGRVKRPGDEITKR